jgi:hypothetical protein
MDEKYLFILCIKFCADLVICDVFVVLLWLLTAACIKSGRPQIAKRAIELVERAIELVEWKSLIQGCILFAKLVLPIDFNIPDENNDMVEHKALFI